MGLHNAISSNIIDPIDMVSVTRSKATFHLFLYKIQLTVQKTIPNPSRGARKHSVGPIVSPWQVV